MKKIRLIFIFSLGVVFNLNGQNDTALMRNVIVEWTEAHNQHDIDKIGKLYAPTLLFYCQNLPKEKCLSILADAFQKNPNFHQQLVSNIQYTFYENGKIKCDFTKAVMFKKGFSNYACYLVLQKQNDKYLIIVEGDPLTDSNLKYTLDIGKQVVVSSFSLSTYIIEHLLWFVVGGALLLIFILVVYIIILKGKNKTTTNSQKVDNAIDYSKEYKSDKLFEIKTSNDNQNSLEPAIPIQPISDENKNNNNWSKLNDVNVNEYINQTFAQSRTFFTKLFDTIDWIDVLLYGKRMKYFVIGTLLVLVVSPIADWILSNKDGNITFYATLFYTLLIFVSVLSLISSWRDDDGNWKLKRVMSKLKSYTEDVNDSISNSKKNTKDENIYRLGKFLLFGGLIWRSLFVVSIFIRKLMGLNTKFLKDFELFTNINSIIPIMLGIGVIFYLYNKNPKLLTKIKFELGELFSIKHFNDSKYDRGAVKIINNSNSEQVYNTKIEQHVTNAKSISESKLFSDFANALYEWNPRYSNNESGYQDSLERHLKKYFPPNYIQVQYPSKMKFSGTKYRFDIVINDTILVEMKKSSSSGEIQRAIGQIGQYSKIWQGQGPVILLLCDYDFEHAKLVYGTAMNDLAKLNRPVLTFVAKPLVKLN